MRKFFYNNNHVRRRVYGEAAESRRRRGLSSRVIVKRDYSGHWGTACNYCEKEIHGKPACEYKVEGKEQVIYEYGKEIARREIKTGKSKAAIGDALLQGMIGGFEREYCNTCLGKLKVFQAEFKAKMNEKAA